ncbi:MAG: hypothetical protein J0H63_14695, partial [Rhizobiales bacterium]|nr:hypothetical protein [Hyphomicrobiales bacterium]
MAHIVETTVYELHELSDAAKDKARDWFREGVGDWDWHDFIFEDFEEICRILGIELRTHSVRLMGGGTRQKSCIWFTGFSSQGDGACFEGSYRYESKSPRRIREHAPQDAELHRIADCLFEIQRDNFFQLHAGISHRGRYCHAYSMEISVERDSPFYQDMTAKAEDAVNAVGPFEARAVKDPGARTERFGRKPAQDVRRVGGQKEIAGRE